MSRSAFLGEFEQVTLLAVDRMERKGLIRSKVGEPTPERGGRAKRFYELSPPGLKALVDARETLDRFWENLELDPEVPA